jgi:insertion element IS1 protein InsB
VAVVEVQCPKCGSGEVVKYGRQANGEQRYRCHNSHCERTIFLLHYHDKGRVPQVKGRREDQAFLELKELLEPLGIRCFYTDGWGAYHRHLDPNQQVVGKRATQQLERKQLTFRTRIKHLVRKTICFSKSIEMHDIVIGLLINRFEFGLPV